MMKRSNLLISVFVSYLTIHNDVNGFSTIPAIDGNRKNAGAGGVTRTTSRTPTHLNVISSFSSGNYFFDDFNQQQRDDGSGNSGGSDSDDSSSSSQHPQNHVQHESSSSSNSDSDIKFVIGDDLHRLRHQVLAMRLELQEARREAEEEDDEEDEEETRGSEYSSSSISKKVQELERSIMKTQQVDAEFVYTVSLERKELAEQDGNMIDAQRYHELAMEARSALPQFDLEGLWVGKYGDQEYEMINITYAGDTLLAHKVTSGTKHVPRGAETFRVDLSPQLGFKNYSNEPLNNSNRYNNNNNRQQQQYQQQQNNDAAPQVLSPIELGDSAAKQWGCKYLQRFAGIGQVASEGYQDCQWMDGQLILVNEYFSFAWLPIGHQVFFGRPTPELILKLMKDEKKKEHTSGARAFLEKCWEETEHIEDDMEIDCNINDINYDTTSPAATNTNTADSNCYYQDGCWE